MIMVGELRLKPIELDCEPKENNQTIIKLSDYSWIPKWFTWRVDVGAEFGTEPL